MINAKIIGRETFLVPMKWENDWPVVNEGKNITLQGEGPGLYQLQQPTGWRDDFTDPELQLGWYRKSKLFRFSIYLYPHTKLESQEMTSC